MADNNVDITKLEMSRAMFGADNWIAYYYKLESYDWPQITCGGQLPPTGADPSNPDCPGDFIEQVDYRQVWNDPERNLIDPDLRPMRTQEFSVGLDHELNRVTVASVRYTHKQLDRAIEDVGTTVPGVGRVFMVANPGYGMAEYTLGENFPVQPPATRDYDGIEFRLGRRFRNNWAAGVSYLYSRLWGNYPGLASSDEGGRTSPNVEQSFDTLHMAYDLRGNLVMGRLGSDRPHIFKLFGMYDFSWGTMISTGILWQSGRPLSLQMSQHQHLFFPEGRGSMGRTPPWFQVGLTVQQNFRLPGDMRVNLQVNIINLFDTDTVDDVDTSPYRDYFRVSDELYFSGSWDPAVTAAGDTEWRYDDKYGKPRSWMERRTIRFQVRLVF